jgi:hypothetical protein
MSRHIYSTGTLIVIILYFLQGHSVDYFVQGHYVDGILHGPGRGRLTSGLSFKGRFNNGFLGMENFWKHLKLRLPLYVATIPEPLVKSTVQKIRFMYSRNETANTLIKFAKERDTLAKTKS